MIEVQTSACGFYAAALVVQMMRRTPQEAQGLVLVLTCHYHESLVMN
jgi:hypothetical protein